MLAEHGGRSVRIRALPIGIPFENFQSLAESSTENLCNHNLKVILGVDRLDYTKGINNHCYSTIVFVAKISSL